MVEHKLTSARLTLLLQVMEDGRQKPGIAELHHSLSLSVCFIQYIVVHGFVLDFQYFATTL